MANRRNNRRESGGKRKLRGRRGETKRGGMKQGREVGG